MGYPRLKNIAPTGFNPNAPANRGVRAGDILVDFTGVDPNVGIIRGAFGAYVVQMMGGGGGGPELTTTVFQSTPGGAGSFSATLRAEVRKASDNVPIPNARVRLDIKSAPGVAGVALGAVGKILSVAESSLLGFPAVHVFMETGNPIAQAELMWTGTGAGLITVNTTAILPSASAAVEANVNLP